ncbi:unnamed protein product [Adineta ricciae]|uniref:Uncharacterized protein n=1 Tax=Adineta ricciae TaxID=249248 RepID=A0A814IC67_ADIRI|nr:unnamed protein product [Adineta ricciae]CAF1145805.1 unnamed protein product [Adineta ricciae]
MSYNAATKKKNSWKLFPKVDRQQEQAATIDTTKENINALEIPFGVRMANNSYTCPMLAIHLHTQKQFSNGRTLIDREILTDKKNEEAIFIGNRRLKEEAEAHAVEEVTMIPLDDVMNITYASDISKKIQAEVQEDIEIIPDSSNSCWKSTRKTAVVPYVKEGTDSMLSNRNVTRSPDEILVSKNRVDGIFCRKKKKQNRLRKQTKITDHQIERTIIMVIEYSKHNYTGTPTDTQYLSNGGRCCSIAELRFYLMKDTKTDPKQFDLTKRYAETLCRTVMQIKGMKHNYPSNSELQTLLTLNHLGTFGYVYNEPSIQVSTGLVLPGTTDPQYQQFHFVPHNSGQYYQRKMPYQQICYPVLTPRVVGTSPFLRQQ